MQDDPKRSPKATKFLESLTSDRPGFVPLVAIVELVWVLTPSYGLARDQVAQALDLLLRSKGLVVDRTDVVLRARRRFAQGGADFTDWLIERIAKAHGCQTTMTFEIAAAESAGMTLVA